MKNPTRFSRFPLTLGCAAVLAAGAAGCSQNAFEQVAVTREPAVVAGCQKVDDVSVAAKTPQAEVATDLSNEARRKGGNYVLVASDDARTGTAYRCSAPAVTTGSGGAR